MANRNKALKLSLLSSLIAGSAAGVSVPQTAHAQVLAPLVDVCTGISLPRSALTDFLTDLNTPLVASLEGGLNDLLGIALLPPLSTDLTTIIGNAAAGDAIGVSLLDTGGTLVGPGDCNLTVDGVSLNDPQGISIGGNSITGLGSGTQASAGALDAIAFGNNARTGAGLAGAIAIGTDANVTAANAVALGAGSLADRANSVSVGAAGNLRLIANVADGTAATDAATVGQVAAAIGTATANAVQYTDGTHTAIALDGLGGTTISGVAAGELSGTSTQAVNGAQLFATNQQVDLNTTAISNLDGRVTINEGAITSLDARVTINEGAITNLQGLVANVPVGYVDDATGTVPSAVPTNTVAFEGATAAPVRVTNVAAGNLTATSTDAVNGTQLYTTNQQVAANTTTINQHTTQITNLATGLANVPIQYSNPGTPTTANGGVVTNDVTLVGAGAGPVALHNVGPGLLPNDAVNVGQFSTGLSTVLNNANAYTDARIAAVGFDLGRLRQESFAGTAGALAAAGLPQVTATSGMMVAGAVGHYRGQTAFALGLSSAINDGRGVLKFNGTIDTHGYAGVSGGAGFAF